MPPESSRVAPEGAAAHYRALESLYAAAPINRFFDSALDIPAAGQSRIRFTVDERHFHAAGAAHGTSYFKMLDDAAFYACNSLVTDRFLLTTQFSLLLTRPLGEGPVIAEGRWYGEIIDTPRGENGFGYDPYFLVPEFDKTGAELDEDTKNSISHRGQALRDLVEKLKQQNRLG